MAEQKKCYLVSYDLVGKSLEDSQLIDQTLEERFQAKRVLRSSWVIRSDDADVHLLAGRLLRSLPQFSERRERLLVIPMKDPEWFLINPLTNPKFF